MLEKQLQFLFHEFLKSKGYSIHSLLYEVKLKSLNSERILQPDLVILDTVSNDYLALIEFKIKFNPHIQRDIVLQLNDYLSHIGTNLPAFLVFPISDDDFQILILRGNYFEPISKEEFPTFENLIGNNIASKKNELLEIEKKRLTDLESKKKKAWVSSVFSILSIIFGVLFTLISIKYQTGKDEVVPKFSNCCDSLFVKINEIEHRLNAIENSKVYPQSQALKINPEIKKLSSRISIIEDGISENPEKTLSLIKINQKIEFLEQKNDFTKELMQTKIDALKGEMSMQSLWMTGVLIAIFGCILSFTIPILVSKIKENWLKI